MSEAITTGALAAMVGARCEGDAERLITGVASLERAGPQDLSFFTGARYAATLERTRAGAVILAKGEVPAGVVALRFAEPRLAYAKIAAALVPLTWPEPGVHPLASVDPTARVDGATVGPFAVIEAGVVIGRGSYIMAHAFVGRDAKIGERCRIQPHAVVMERCIVGDRVWLKPGAVVGADGFGHVRTPEGPLRVPQLGVAILEDDVEVGANACVDRAALDETRVGQGTRLDNLVQIAHGVKIGAHCLLAAFAGVAGGARLGNGVTMAGRTAVVDGVEVGDRAVFAALASASRTVPPNTRIGGSPARNYAVWLREVAALRRLPDLLRRFDRLERGSRADSPGEDE